MCIRDSVYKAYFSLKDALTKDDGTTAAAKAKELFKAVDAAVSYTHLRAHETVLDLVCRLLLEKKNTNISSTTTTNTC